MVPTVFISRSPPPSPVEVRKRFPNLFKVPSPREQELIDGLVRVYERNGFFSSPLRSYSAACSILRRLKEMGLLKV